MSGEKKTGTLTKMPDSPNEKQWEPGKILVGKDTWTFTNAKGDIHSGAQLALKNALDNALKKRVSVEVNFEVKDEAKKFAKDVRLAENGEGQGSAKGVQPDQGGKKQGSTKGVQSARDSGGQELTAEEHLAENDGGQEPAKGAQSAQGGKALIDKYGENIAIPAYLCMATSQMLVLTGSPGKGKSSFARDFAHAIGAEFTMIQVQSNWSSSEDLFGYYDPIKKVFYKTTFLNALLKAKENQEKLHIICLDEMNLARVEHYFATILSLLPMAPDERKITDVLPSCTEGQDEIPANIKGELGVVEIPENVRFIGTINMDHTTHPLSPKVIDRSFFIPFDTRTAFSPNDGPIKQPDTPWLPLNVNASDNQLEEKDFENNVAECLRSVENPRFRNAIEWMYAQYMQDKEASPDAKDPNFDDYMFVGMKLPRIKDCRWNPASSPEFLQQELEEMKIGRNEDGSYKGSNSPHTCVCFELMEKNAKETGTYTFFY